jgi:hypothetical protein
VGRTVQGKKESKQRALTHFAHKEREKLGWVREGSYSVKCRHNKGIVRETHLLLRE